MFFVIAGAVLLFLIHKYLTANNNYFEKKGIPFNKPTFIVGSRGDLILRNKTVLDVVLGWYNEFYGEK
jgi:hypothetical protein